MAREVALEIAVQDTDGVRIAAEVGARRVELCAALGATGGLTPSIGLVEAAVAVAADVAGTASRSRCTLVRPRPGGFVFDAAALDVQIRDVRAVVAAAPRAS
ncbi:copper homeostasis protein CutC [Oerskovia sp. M15]